MQKAIAFRPDVIYLLETGAFTDCKNGAATWPNFPAARRSMCWGWRSAPSTRSRSSDIATKFRERTKTSVSAPRWPAYGQGAPASVQQEEGFGLGRLESCRSRSTGQPPMVADAAEG